MLLAKTPGHLFIDTVSHGGGSKAGDYVWTLTVTDGYTQWSLNRAVWNRGRHAGSLLIQMLTSSLPFNRQSGNHKYAHTYQSSSRAGTTNQLDKPSSRNLFIIMQGVT